MVSTEYGELQKTLSLAELKFIAPSIGLLKVKTSPLITLWTLSFKYSDCIPSSPGTTICNISFPPSTLVNRESFTLGKKSIPSILIS